MLCVAVLQGLAAKAEQLLVTTFELQELQQQHTSLKGSMVQLQQQLQTVAEELTTLR